MPAPQTNQENCVAHNGSIVPVPGRDIFVQAWYQGGVSVIDFTDSSKPLEIAYFDRGPIDEIDLIPGGYWSTYWYRGLVYGTEQYRGLDVFRLLPSPYLTANEIAAAALADHGAAFNPQQQFPVTWPHETAVARAYVDQIERMGEVMPERADDVNELLGRVQKRLDNGVPAQRLVARLSMLATSLRHNADQSPAGMRQLRLADTLEGLAMRLR